MKPKTIITTFLCLSSLYAPAATAQSIAECCDANRNDAKLTPNSYRANEVIIKLKPQASQAMRLQPSRGGVSASRASSELNGLLTKYGASGAEELMALTGGNKSQNPSRAIDHNGNQVGDPDNSALYLVRLDNADDTDILSIAKEFSSIPEVEYAEPNYIVKACVTDYSSDPMYTKQWNIPAVGLDKLWNVPAVSTKRPVIAILDTGVDIEHPDLAANIWTNDREANGVDDVDDDGNGYADDIHGWDFVNQSAMMRDNNGHGTHCAGIAAAVGGNGIGITGANPEALIMPITVLQSNGTGDIATIIKGIDYAVANGADVISMSFGGYTHSIAEHDALAKAYHTAVLVAAAGNDNYSIYKPGATMFPAAYSFVLGVEASRNTAGELASFSNFDDDGPVTSIFSDLYNYELRAPGEGILSTFPGGQYKTLNGTSMACPLVAGAISRLISCRDITSNENLFGDLISTAKGNIDIFGAYNLTDADRRPSLALVTYRLDDAKMGDGDGRPDAGETIRIYPTFRNSWGYARNITYSIRLHDLEDKNVIEFIDNEAAHVLSNLSSYASVEAESPFLVKISPDCVDGRVIRFVIEATCDNIAQPLSQEIQLTVENGIELSGIIGEDMTLTPDKTYIVTTALGVPKGVTLTLQPGVTLYFKDNTGLSVSGKIVANGEPGNMITFTRSNLGQGVVSSFDLNQESEFNYVNINNLYFQTEGNHYSAITNATFNNSIIENVGSNRFLFEDVNFIRCALYNNNSYFYGSTTRLPGQWKYCNLSRIAYTGNVETHIQPLDWIEGSNVFNNRYERITSSGHEVYYPMSGAYYTTLTVNYKPETPNYHGSSSKETVRKSILDINHIGSMSNGQYDISNMLERPVNDAHGIVWKVVVNGYDAQDEYDQLPPLGVGKHKFEVYFNRSMNHEKTPMIAMGVREPYTQTSISEDGAWRTETYDGETLDVYTAYLTIKGRDDFDGENTIYVADAEDDEFFPIPVEDARFRVNVQSAGAMSTGFTAEAGVGRVTLKWENPEDNFDDMLGYNMYRYTLDSNEMAGDTIRINDKLISKEEMVDYDIVPGKTYCYYYKVLRTSLMENAPSRVVSATPRAAGKGDADASGDVDVADVVTEVNYMVGRAPKPFMFEAADINDDKEIDILDVVGTVNIIMAPKTMTGAMSLQSEATYTIENGILYIDSPVEIAGVQVEISGDRNSSTIKALEGVDGMETTGAWLNETDYRMIAFSLSGKAITSGRHAIAEIGETDVEHLILVNSSGERIAARSSDMSGINDLSANDRGRNAIYPNPFDEIVNILLDVDTAVSHDIIVGFTNIAGNTVLTAHRKLEPGEHVVSLRTAGLPAGLYIVTLTVDGNAVDAIKAFRK